jgi:NAD(P)H-flavin reductase
MTEKDHLCNCQSNPLVPQVCLITDIREETPDIKTFRVQTKDGKKPFSPLPGQLAMFSLLGVGEGMFSITAQGDDYLDFAIKRCGMLTDALHEVAPGQEIGLRGPYGNHFPIEEAKGKDILFIAAGSALLPYVLLSVTLLLTGKTTAKSISYTAPVPLPTSYSKTTFLKHGPKNRIPEYISR